MKNNSIGEKEAHPAVTSNVLIFSVHNKELQVILCNRDHEPFKGYWSIPGGLIHIDESLEDAAKRQLQERTGIHSDSYLEQLYTFGDPKRDPRERRINVTYFALVSYASVEIQEPLKHSETAWFSIKKLPELAFDHSAIVKRGIERIKGKIIYSNIAHGLLPKKFSLTDLQNVYEILLGKHLDKRNFRKKMLSLGLLESSGKKTVGRHRPALLYHFKTRAPVFF